MTRYRRAAANLLLDLLQPRQLTPSAISWTLWLAKRRSPISVGWLSSASASTLSKAALAGKSLVLGADGHVPLCG